MTYAPEVMDGIRRGWITILEPPRPRGPGQPPLPPEEARRRKRLRTREGMRRLRAIRKLGRPIVPNVVPVNRSMFSNQSEWRRAYDRLHHQLRRNR